MPSASRFSFRPGKLLGELKRDVAVASDDELIELGTMNLNP